MIIRRATRFASVLVLALLAGCVAHGSRPSYKGSTFQMIIAAETVSAAGPDRRMTEEEVQREVDRLLALEPSSPIPARVLLFDVPSSGPSQIASARKALLLRKETSQALKKALEDTGLFDQIDFLPEIYLPHGVPQDLKTLRIAAARAHADGLLIYSTEAGYEYEPNLLGRLLYITIVGAFVVPGSKESAMAASKAVLVDVRTGYIYRVMETYGEESEVRPVAFLDEEALEFEARRKALTALAELAAEKVKELSAEAE